MINSKNIFAKFAYVSSSRQTLMSFETSGFLTNGEACANFGWTLAQ